MKIVSKALAIAAFAALAACGGNDAADNVVENAENTAESLENQADALVEDAENQADALENSADNVVEAAENEADAIEANTN